MRRDASTRRARRAARALALGCALLLAGASIGRALPPSEAPSSSAAPAASSAAPASEAGSSSASGGAYQFSRRAFDLTVLRPLQLIQVIVSAAVFLPAYAVSLPFGGDEDVLEICITEPVDRAFRRPLGEL